MLQSLEQSDVQQVPFCLSLSRSSFECEFLNFKKKALNAELKNSVYTGFGACMEPPVQQKYNTSM